MEKEEVLFQNTSKLDASEMESFQIYAMKKVNLFTSIIFALIFVGIGVGVSFIELTFGIISIACGILGGFVLLPYLMKESIKKQNAKNADERKFLNTYDFYQDYVEIASEVAMPDSNDYNQLASQNLYYQEVYQVVLFKENLFLYLNPQQAFIISHKGMTKGTIGEVIDFLKAKEIKLIDKSNK